jgi:HD-GYP domain-containing protein (c-di-GMP phosphodiesterase class II)
LDISAKSIKNMQVLLTKRFLWILFSGIIFSLFMGWMVAKNITHPLKSLMRGVKEVGMGDLSKKVMVSSRDEIGDLAHAFNKMTEELLKAKNTLRKHYLDTIKSLARALEAKDPYSEGHSEKVRDYAVGIARYLGLPDKDIKLLDEVCILHDIGKIGIPEKILTKPGPLTSEEKKIMETHPQIGEDIVRHIDFLEPGLKILRNHHERPDGKGYPDGLKIDEISLLASIVSVADAFDAMTSDRPYRKALTKEEAINILIENKGIQFESVVVDVFIDSLKNSDIIKL